MSRSGWGVVATIDEPAALTAAFAAWHLEAGAREVHIFLDTPNPEAEALLAALPGCHVTRCDAAYWAAQPQGRRFHRHTTRQEINAAKAYAATQCALLLHCDADEFVRSGAALSEALCALPPDAPGLHLRMSERVHVAGEETDHIFGGAFRRSHRGFDGWGGDVYGRFAKFLRAGFTGHTAGKVAVRSGLPVSMGVHFPKDGDGQELPGIPSADGLLLHFDGLTPLHYVLKLLRRAYEPEIPGHPPRPHGPSRIAQLRYMRNKAGLPREVRRLTDGVQALDAAQAAALTAAGALDRTPFDPRPALAAFGLDVDLSPAAFDAELVRRDAALIAKSGLSLPF